MRGVLWSELFLKLKKSNKIKNEKLKILEKYLEIRSSFLVKF